MTHENTLPRMQAECPRCHEMADLTVDMMTKDGPIMACNPCRQERLSALKRGVPPVYGTRSAPAPAAKAKRSLLGRRRP